jgi:hypothetical protein
LTQLAAAATKSAPSTSEETDVHEARAETMQRSRADDPISEETDRKIRPTWASHQYFLFHTESLAEYGDFN